MNVFVFDIETVPDIDSGRRLHDLDGLSDKEIADIMFHLRRQETGGSEFLRLHLHRIVAISAVFRRGDSVDVWSLGEKDSSEKELIQQFFGAIEEYTPTLVSWNGGGFDLPVLNYRALLHGVSAPRYWGNGDSDQSFRLNNYQSRYHARHTDLMDVLSGFQSGATASLNEMATILGFPGKMGMDGSKVWNTFMQGDVAAIRDYCETDVLNTYLVYLKFEVTRGNLSQSEYDRECELLHDVLAASEQAHLLAFMQAWDNNKF